MSEAEKPNKGLLSKVVRFVTKPTTQWSELDKVSEPENPEEQYSKQALKEILERKRRNDFVRKLEFDQLRKIRREANKSSGAAADSLGPRNSAAMLEAALAAEGSPSKSAKALHPGTTIDKINEIEQQMSKQWWSGETPAGAAPATAPAPGPTTDPASLNASATAPTPLAAEAEVSAPLPVANAADLAPGAFDAQVESGRFIHDTDLEEAAVLFANGDTAGAESSLLALVQERNGDLMGQLTIWLTLFDLYRATGDQTKFDFHAIEFASKYGRSAPVWFSMPDELGAKAKQAAADEGEVRLLNWQAPPALSTAALVGLQGNIKRFPPPWTLNWSRVTEVRDEAVAPLLTLFRVWAEQADARLVFVGADNLLAVLEQETPVGDKATAEDRWSLRLALLRILGLEQDFENAALDYCITYEVSPPSWVKPKLEMNSDSTRVGGPVARDSFLQSEILDKKPAAATEGPHAVLEGIVEGDASKLLDAFTPLVEPGHPFTVRCDRLMRIDFVAAGSVLNWVAECQQKNALVRFGNLHRLNAVFFNLIGINEHSIVTQREN